MDAATVAFQRQLIRLAKGIISAWEEWLRAKSGEAYNRGDGRR